MDFLKLAGKTVLVTGVANKKSIAFAVSKSLIENGVNVILAVQNEEILQKIRKHFIDNMIFICDVEKEESIINMAKDLVGSEISLSGIVHSIAFADFSEGVRPFHETKLNHFLQATNVSCFSLVSLANNLKEILVSDASIVTISISELRATSYGYMGPIKAALNSSVAYLAKSFSGFSNIRFNAVCSGPLKTTASAGIPNYVDNYLFAEKLTLRKQALDTEEVSNVVVFLLSPVSNGINASGITVDAGMSCNYFDSEVVDQTINR